jgi:nitrate reductase delta subunit
MPQAEKLDSLAALLRYPDESYFRSAQICQGALRGVPSDILALLENFCRRISSLSTEELQELFTQTFDLNPVCSLEVGWHLFGEQYERGEFLVRMRQQMRRFGVAESTELPDHLTHVLSVLGRMEQEEAEKFASACVYPALDKMRAGLAEKDNLFEVVLELIARVMENHYERPAELAVQTPALRVIQERGLA